MWGTSEVVGLPTAGGSMDGHQEEVADRAKEHITHEDDTTTQLWAVARDAVGQA